MSSSPTDPPGPAGRPDPTRRSPYEPAGGARSTPQGGPPNQDGQGSQHGQGRQHGQAASTTPPPPRSSEAPPGPEAGPRGSRPPRGSHEDRSAFERIFPELLKRGLEASRGTIGNVSDTFFSRDVANGLIAQLGEMREGVVSAVAQEVGRFLRQADIAAEIRNVLTGMEVEAHVKIKFRKSEDGGSITTDVEIEDPPPKRPRRWR